MGGAAALRGQSALDGFDPNANGTVNVVVVQPDGKILLGGDFTTLSPNDGAPVTRNHIARLNPDGTLDTVFNPNANDAVYAIAVQTDGKILVGGLFNGTNSIGGQTRNHIARLDATTGLADSFDPDANFLVFSLALQADGRVLAGGDFTTMGGETRNHMARLNTDGTLDTAFNPNANGFVSAIAVQADGKILAGGDFNGANGIGGQPRNFIARLDPATGLADSFNPNANLFVRTIAVQADGKILVGGYFNGANSIGGQTRNRIARLDPATGLADSFDPNANNIVRSIVVQADGKILVGGFFNGSNSIGGQARNFIARLDATTGLADSANPNANGSILALAVQSDGKILVGGSFNGALGISVQRRNRIARLEIDGRLDRTLPDLQIPVDKFGVGHVRAIAVQPDGKILFGGNFYQVLGTTRIRIARLNTDGTLDTAFDPRISGSTFYVVNSIAVLPDGKILVGGDFATVSGQTRNNIARLDPTTGLADSFNPNANGIVYSIAVQADGKILAGGRFTNIGGEARQGLARLDPTTGLVDSFNPQNDGGVWSLAVQTDGKILAGGYFTTIGGQTRNGIARLDPVTALADSFNPNPNQPNVGAIAVQTDGKVFASGGFTNIGGQTRNGIARLDATTGLADSFDPNPSNVIASLVPQADGKILVSGGFTSIGGQPRNGIARLDPATGSADSFDPNADGEVVPLSVQVDGKILASGYFASIGGQTRSAFARLSNDTAAFQGLAVRQTDVTWTRSGSSVQFWRVTFESSTDNVNYAPLGNGTPLGSNWILTGLNLPIGQNLYVRARGYHRNGSDSIMESVRNVFLTEPTGTPTPTPSPTPTMTPTATPTPTPSPTPTMTPTATPPAPPTPTPSATPTTLGNISTRLRVETGDNVLIGGFIVTGTQPKRVILRAIGPSLPVAGALADPVLELRDSSGVLIQSNDNWRSDQEAEIIATTIAPGNDLESAIVAILPANGSAYTAIVHGVNSGTGIGVVEAYDLDPTANSKLANISTRGLVQTGDNVLIGGTIVLGQNSQRVIVRAIGPSLPVPGALGDPTLELRDGNGGLLASNDNWQSDQETEIIATGIPPANDLESAIVTTLPANGASYTAIVSGTGGTTGIGAVEVYALQ
jgi:uncharacterized delta-60 repeat protein